MSIDVNNESGTEVDEQAILDIARYALARMRIHPLSELSVIVVDADAMEQLHLQWMDLPGPTDVMSFPMDELRPPSKDDEEPPQGLLGDIVLCPEVAEKQGERGADAALHGRGAPAPHRPRSAAPAGVRPRGAGREGRDVRSPGRHRGRLARGEGPDRSVPGPDRRHDRTSSSSVPSPWSSSPGSPPARRRASRASPASAPRRPYGPGGAAARSSRRSPPTPPAISTWRCWCGSPARWRPASLVTYACLRRVRRRPGRRWSSPSA